MKTEVQYKSGLEQGKVSRLVHTFRVVMSAKLDETKPLSAADFQSDMGKAVISGLVANQAKIKAEQIPNVISDMIALDAARGLASTGPKLKELRATCEEDAKSALAAIALPAKWAGYTIIANVTKAGGLEVTKVAKAREPKVAAS